jgi:hypothetical protein
MSETTQLTATNTADREELQRRIERQIVLGTWGRIHDLYVQLTSDGLHITARTPSHYIKQLVLHAVYEVLGTETTLPLQFDIQVGKIARQVLPGDNDLWGVPRTRAD